MNTSRATRRCNTHANRHFRIRGDCSPVGCINRDVAQYRNLATDAFIRGDSVLKAKTRLAIVFAGQVVHIVNDLESTFLANAVAPTGTCDRNFSVEEDLHQICSIFNVNRGPISCKGDSRHNLTLTESFALIQQMPSQFHASQIAFSESKVESGYY